MAGANHSTQLLVVIDTHDRLNSFQFTKGFCGRNISGSDDYEDFCRGNTLHNIFHFSFSHVCKKLSALTEEEQYLLFLEWDALRTAIAKYLGMEAEDIDKDRCLIESIEEHADGTEMSMILLPPKDLPNVAI